LTKSLAREFAPFGIRVNALSPGTIRTSMTKTFAVNKLSEIPLGRLGEPSEVAAMAAFICSDEANYITGEIVDINGGQLMD
jgi:NAD(P)-dependent dehydrogenase (short-subunit alcohol dehydrogenase family)